MIHQSVKETAFCTPSFCSCTEVVLLVVNEILLNVAKALQDLAFGAHVTCHKSSRYEVFQF
jgi:hypothetical protein